MMKALLQARGFRVQYERVRALMHSVDSTAVISRMCNVGCIARQTYSLPGPQSLMHIDTNHKLIRYNIVVFGGIDGFPCKIMYLGAANNNLASTTLAFFQESVEKWGFPLRIERLWRDLWMAVTCIYYDVLHHLEEEGFLSIANEMHLFCCYFVFLPRLQDDLDTFHSGWDNHSLRTESHMTPNQLWELGLTHYPVPGPDNTEVMDIPDIDWENSGLPCDDHLSVVVPHSACP